MYVEALTMLNMSQKAMEYLVGFGICIAVVGVILVLYWRFIIFGAFGLFCCIVLANRHVDVPVDTAQKVPVKQEQKIEQSEDEKQFIEDCLNSAEYSREECQNIWNDGRQETKSNKSKSRPTPKYMQEARFQKL